MMLDDKLGDLVIPEVLAEAPSPELPLIITYRNFVTSLSSSDDDCGLLEIALSSSCRTAAAGTDSVPLLLRRLSWNLRIDCQRVSSDSVARRRRARSGPSFRSTTHPTPRCSVQRGLSETR